MSNLKLSPRALFGRTHEWYVMYAYMYIYIFIIRHKVI